MDSEGGKNLPRREIKDISDMKKWQNSEAYKECIGFIETLNLAVKGKPNSCKVTCSDGISSLLSLLDQLEKVMQDTPPQTQPQRFGNKAFSTFYYKIQHQVPDMLKSILPKEIEADIPEISMYLIDSFGNSTRIDYGSGHELNFILFLYCLFRKKFLSCDSMDDKVATVTKVFNKYLILVRSLQKFYHMEPAGSHGVWSLDDYQFIPFVWGSSQLIGHSTIEPSGIIDASVVEMHYKDYLFLGCIKHILDVKTGPFFEHSNQLWNISGIPAWTKVNSGLIKMYRGEVMEKFPVVQHILFGSIVSINPFYPPSAS